MADEFDASGWAQIHQAANRGYLKSIQFFVKDDPSLLELETTDGKNLTPFLCAVDGGKIEAVHQMIELGSKIDAINSQNHGAVEMCAMKSYIDLLNYFIEKDFEKIPVWKNLLRFVTSESDEEAEAAGKSLRTLTQGSQADGINPNWKSFYDHGGVPVIIKVAKSSIGEEAKIPAFQTLLNIIEREEVKEQVLSSGGIPTFIKLLKSTNHFLIQLSAEILKEMATVTDYAEAVSQNNGIQSLIKVLQTIHNPEVLVQVLDCLGNIAEHDKKYQDLVGQQQGCVQTIVQLLEYEKDKDFLNSACRTVGKVCYNNETNQNSFVDASAIPHVLAVTRLRNKDIQVTAVECIRKVAANNPYSQKQMQTDQVQELLLKLLGTTRSEVVKEKTALALWAIAGREFDVKRLIAERMGVGTLVEFINSMSEDLNFIGSEGLGVLAQGPLSYHSDIANANGIAPLGRLIRSEKEYIVLSVIRAIRFLCLGVGYVPHKKNQNTIMTIRGIKLIVALMVHSRNQMIQVEAALTLASVSLGNQAILDDIHSNIDFSYVRILKMMYSMDPDVRLLAGLALATFAYNNVNQQKEIADQGGVRFNCFCPFLQSEDEYYRCLAAFQVVVLARIIPDEEQALSSAAGIKLLVDLLQDSSNNETLSLAADCIARLAHTRAGVPAAMISINVIEHLCKLLVSTAEQVRGSAAIALGYLSYNHTGERQLLNKCRTDPYLMRILLHYTKRSKISPCFLEAWQHYKKVGLPPIPEGRTNLIGNHPLGMDGNRPVTFLSIDPEGETGSNTRSSTSNIGGEDGRITGRSSRASGSRQATTPRQSGTPLNATTPLNASQISLDSQHSSRSLLPVTAEGNA